MLFCPAVLRFLLTGMLPVLPHGADGDADAAGGYAAAGEFGAVCCAGSLISESFGVVPLIERSYGAGVDTPHAPGAEVVFPQGIGREVCGGDDRAKPNPRALFGGYEGVVHAERPEPGEVCGMPVREEG